MGASKSNHLPFKVLFVDRVTIMRPQKGLQFNKRILKSND